VNGSGKCVLPLLCPLIEIVIDQCTCWPNELLLFHIYNLRKPDYLFHHVRPSGYKVLLVI